jgi:hypothetical protein
MQKIFQTKPHQAILYILMFALQVTYLMPEMLPVVPDLEVEQHLNV